MAKLTLTPQQQAVVENRGGSLLVSAAAGSGKTKVLVDRLFRYVTEERCNIDDFLIITYTKAAAAELRSKIASELSKRLGQTPGDQQLRRQLLRVYQADIKTVDAFCTSLLRENTHLLAREGDVSGALASADQLGRLGQYVERLLHQIAREVRDGNIDADPCCHNEDDSFCKYCDWADACHFQDGRDGDHLHYILPVKPEEFWRQVEEETERGGGQ